MQSQLKSFMFQKWEHLLFLHWPVDEKLLSASLPKDLRLDLYEGHAWVSVVGFRLTGLKVKPLTFIPWNDFSELNLRTYARDGAGNRGVWFYSLDASDPFSVIGAKVLYGLNYRFASMQFRLQENSISYSSKTRFSPPEVKGEIEAELPETLVKDRDSANGGLDRFLLERYRFWSSRKSGKSKSSSAKVSHEPYEAIRLKSAIYKGNLFACHGLEEPEETPACVHYCKGFEVEASAPEWAFSIAGQANHK